VIPIPVGWRARVGDGVTVLTRDAGGARLRYRERVAPLQPVQALVRATLAEAPEWRTLAVGARERIITAEGELAFWVPAAGELLGAPARRFIGVVYGDDFADVLDLLVSDTASAAGLAHLSRELTRDTALRLGVRPRRYGFAPPPGWHGRAVGLAAHYYPPDFPLRPATIVVYPANPIADPPEAVFDALLAHDEGRGFTLTALAPPRPLDGAEGAAGKHWRLAGRTAGVEVTRDLVVLIKPPYAYSLHLDALPAADLEAARAAFFALVASIEPVPAPGLRQVPPPVEALELFTSYS
jgi:hypothetical protein